MQTGFSQDGSRYQKYAKDFATENKAVIHRLKAQTKDFDGVTKVYFEVTFKEGTTYWPFNFFCKSLPTEDDIKKLKEDAPVDVFLQWGRKGEMIDGEWVPEFDQDGNAVWGKPKVINIVSKSGEEWELQGDVDQYQGDENETV